MEKRSLAQYAVVTLKGMAMGAADVVPGVSGGTIALVAGIYEELITTINNVNLSLIGTWRKSGFKVFWEQLNGNFLVALFLGIAISVVSLAKGISWLLENQPILLWSFFFGLVVASVLLVAKNIPKWKGIHILLLVVGAAIAYYITQLPPNDNANGLGYLFLSGALAICAMILPGISGAFILVLLGSYKTILDAVHQRDLLIIGVVGLGAVFGLLSFARILKWMFAHYKYFTLAVLTGFILGSLNKIWPWKVVLESKTFGDKTKVIREANIWPSDYAGDSQWLWALLLAILGFSFIFALERLAAKK